jgi:cytochrome b subunit of formate dehydrogenase
MHYPARRLCLVFLAALLPAGGAWAAPMPDSVCADCHQGTGGNPAEVSSLSLVGSVHEGFGCIDCHQGITSVPHAEELAAPDCSGCHGDMTAAYQQHGRALIGAGAAVPTCQDCHGSHQIFGHLDPRSSVYRTKQPATCGACHENQEFIAGLDIRFKHPVEVYQGGVHGRPLAGGDDVAASCTDCHTGAGSTHAILPPGHVDSPINFFNIARTCGRCHNTIQQEFETGIHGQLVALGDVKAPTCTHCHGEHGILMVDDPRSPVSTGRVATATCAPCHDSATLNDRYDVPSGQRQTRVDSYHGLKSRGGDTSVANCASCHGAHLILPESDPRSSVAPANLIKTCGHCHDGMSPEKAIALRIHQRGPEVTSGWAHWVKVAYQALIFMVIGGMTLYCLLDYLRQVRRVLAKKQVRRMEMDEVLQHALLAISFTVLVVTGFSLRFYDAWWAKLVFGHEGGAAERGLIHRIGAIVMIIGSLWHIGYLLTAKGRVFLRDIAPTLNDAKQAWGMAMYNLGRSPEHPQMRRFSFYEKAEYWALIWGTVVMVLTGLAMWFEKFLGAHLGKETLEVFQVIHYYEAWLAFLAILVWHMYGVIFNPHVYPMNPSWMTGKMPKEMFETEHPAAQSPGNVDKMKRLGLEKEV